jgi:hypothetical protein
MSIWANICLTKYVKIEYDFYYGREHNIFRSADMSHFSYMGFLLAAYRAANPVGTDT